MIATLKRITFAMNATHHFKPLRVMIKKINIDMLDTLSKNIPSKLFTKFKDFLLVVPLLACKLPEHVLGCCSPV